MQAPDMITFHCPSCSMKLQVPAQMAGVTGPCPECSASIAAPVASPAPTPAPSPAQQPQGLQQPPAAQPPAPIPVAPNPLSGNNPPSQEPATTPEVTTPSPVALERARQHAEQPKPRARWMRVIFPLAFLLVAAILVLVVLQTVGVFNIWNFNKQQGEATHPSSATTQETETQSPDKPEKSDTTPEVTPADTPPPAMDTPPSIPVIKDNTHPEGEFPELQLPPPPADSSGAGSSPPPPASPTVAKTPEDVSPPKAGFLANQVLRQFLAAKTLDERMALMSRSVHTREELEASCLAGPLKPIKFTRMAEMVPRVEDNMTQYIYFVSFEDKDEERQRHRILVQVVERPGTHPPRVHADAFIEHYEKKFDHYAKNPSNNVTIFHCVAEARTANLSKELPKELKKKMMRLMIKSHPTAASAFNAYVNKNSPLMEKIGPRKDFPLTIPRFCVLSFRWNTTDPAHPYIELSDIVCQGWEK